MYKKLFKKKEKGFSLLELSVAVGVSAIVATAGIVATTAFIGSAQDKRDSYTDRANNSILEAADAYSDLWDGTVPPPATPVLNAASEVTTSSATVSWNGADLAASYAIYLNDSEVEVVPASQTQYTFNGLTDNTEYTYAVESINGGGRTLSAEGTFTTVRSIVAPTAPTSILASNIQASSAELSWTAPISGDTVDEYIIKLNNTVVDTVDGAVLTTNLTGLTVGTEYDVSVTAVNTGGETSGTYTFSTLNVIQATGGTVSTITEGNIIYKVHKFDTVGSDTFTVTNAPAGAEVEYLIVAGGGGGGFFGGGGGAGGMLEGFYEIPDTGVYTVTVGGGGAGAAAYVNASNGENSTAFGITAIGGGGGATRLGPSNGYYAQAGNNGGSGGGSSMGDSGPQRPGGTGITGQGFPGGRGTIGSYNHGGGGGAGAPGGDAISGVKGGDGGAGKPSTITGTQVYYAGGGGGGSYSTAGTRGLGGLGGGGNGGGGIGAPLATPGTPNTGGGGGGVDPFIMKQSTQPGGSGVVIIRYAVGIE